MRVIGLLAVCTFVVGTLGSASVPLILASYRNVARNPFYAAEIEMGNMTAPIQVPWEADRVQGALESIVGECLSDTFVLVRIPSLLLQDFHDWSGWAKTRRLVAQSSSIVTIARVTEGQVNWREVERTLRRNCDVEKIQVASLDEPELARYRDTKTRYIEVDIPSDALYTKPGTDERSEQLKAIDDLIHAIAQKLPTPNLTLLITSTVPEEFSPEDLRKDFYVGFDEIPEDPRQVLPSLRARAQRSNRWIWPDITIFDRSRWFSFERNSDQQRKLEEGATDETWLERKLPENQFHGSNRFDADFERGDSSAEKTLPSIHIYGWDTGVKFDKQLFVDNALLLATAAGLVVLVIFVDILKMAFVGLLALFKGGKPKVSVERKTK